MRDESIAKQTVDTARPQRKRPTKEYMEKKLGDEIWTAGFRYCCRMKMEATGQDRTGWTHPVLSCHWEQQDIRPVSVYE